MLFKCNRLHFSTYKNLNIYMCVCILNFMVTILFVFFIKTSAKIEDYTTYRAIIIFIDMFIKTQSKKIFNFKDVLFYTW